MPELPEVELYSRYFARHGLGQEIEHVRVREQGILGEERKERLARELKAHLLPPTPARSGFTFISG